MGKQGISTKSIIYHANAPHGMGLSGSSNLSVLLSASREILTSYPNLPLFRIAHQAHEHETILANGQTIAAQDVYPIVFGGTQMIKTFPDTLDEKGRKIGKVKTEPFVINQKLLDRHFFVAYHKKGKKHDAIAVLNKLPEHKYAAEIVAEISQIAIKMKAFILAEDLVKIGDCFDRYREIFNNWSDNAYTDGLSRVVEKLKTKIGKDLISWKPPGAGGSDSIAFLISNSESRKIAEEFIRDLGWTVMPVRVTKGLEFGGSRKREIVLSAGYRFDFIGAADLGQDLRVGQFGVCCSCAIEPRAELHLSY